MPVPSWTASARGRPEPTPDSPAAPLPETGPNERAPSVPAPQQSNQGSRPVTRLPTLRPVSPVQQSPPVAAGRVQSNPQPRQAPQAGNIQSNHQSRQAPQAANRVQSTLQSGQAPQANRVQSTLQSRQAPRANRAQSNIQSRQANRAQSALQSHQSPRANRVQSTLQSRQAPQAGRVQSRLLGASDVQVEGLNIFGLSLGQRLPLQAPGPRVPQSRQAPQAGNAQSSPQSRQGQAPQANRAQSNAQSRQAPQVSSIQRNAQSRQAPQAGSGQSNQLVTIASASPSLTGTEVPLPSIQSLLLNLGQVPRAATTEDLAEVFASFGEIVYIELNDPNSRDGFRQARLRFGSLSKPLNSLEFLRTRRLNISVGGTSHSLIVDISQQSRGQGIISTPLHNRCPALVPLALSKLVFGAWQGAADIVSKYTIDSSRASSPPTFFVDYQHKKFCIKFTIQTEKPQELKFDVRFTALRTLYRSRLGDVMTVVLALSDPPRFWRKKASAKQTFAGNRTVWTDNELWCRATEVERVPREADKIVASLDNNYQVVDLGRWTTYWLEISKEDAGHWSAIEALLSDWGLKTASLGDFKLVPNIDPPLWKLLNPAGHENGATAPTSNMALLAEVDTLNVFLPFEVRYQLEVCISHDILSEHDISAEFLEKLARSTEVDPKRARLILEYAADEGKRIVEPMSLFTDKRALKYYSSKAYNLPDYCAVVRRIVVTPTRIYFKTPAVETTNRVLRYHQNLENYFIRVQFTDELTQGRIYGSDTGQEDVLARVFRILNLGIRMGRWHWEFLAYGNSQVRECGAFFFCQPEGQGSLSCDAMRAWMGKLDHITINAKYGARIGQCFSTTRLVPGITKPTIVKIPDIDRAGFCFSDGVGKISNFMATSAIQAWKLRLIKLPSAYQFRLGGCKGVLVCSPDAKGLEVHIRKSQEKFTSDYNGLEVIRYSTYSVATLNRQTITILSALGIGDRVFTNMMSEQLASYDLAMTDEQEAVRLLHQCVDENQTSLIIAQMIRDGFIDAREPFVRTLLRLWRAWSIKALKEKARLVVADSAFLLGCVDETATLRGHSAETEGSDDVTQDQLPQIFLQVPDPKIRGAYKVVTGLCAVGRNPSLHAGDIRVVEAVDVPALRDLRDVVVFPQNGDRDIPSMCSGGDLDGDDFFVVWDEKLIPPQRHWGIKPMEHHAPTQVRKETLSLVGLKTFFVMFMKHDNLPLIAQAHLATADKEKGGAMNPKCEGLARLHSTAVDYVKTGVPADFNKNMQPRKWPHFMEKNNTYRSLRVLGQLYDMVETTNFDLQESYTMPFDARILGSYKHEDKVLETARQIKVQYDRDIRRLMGQQNIATEFEVWTTYVLSKPRVGSGYKQSEAVGRESAAIKQMYREICIQEVGGSRLFEKLGPFVAAMYQVTAEEVRTTLASTSRSTALISFPWLFADVLGRIARGAKPPTTVAEAAEEAEEEEKTEEKDGGEGEEVETMQNPMGVPVAAAGDRCGEAFSGLAGEGASVGPRPAAYAADSDDSSDEGVQGPEKNIMERFDEMFKDM